MRLHGTITAGHSACLASQAGTDPGNRSGLLRWSGRAPRLAGAPRKRTRSRWARGSAPAPADGPACPVAATVAWRSPAGLVIGCVVMTVSSPRPVAVPAQVIARARRLGSGCSRDGTGRRRGGASPRSAQPVESFRTRLAGTVVPGPGTGHDRAGRDRGIACRPGHWVAAARSRRRSKAPAGTILAGSTRERPAQRPVRVRLITAEETRRPRRAVKPVGMTAGRHCRAWCLVGRFHAHMHLRVTPRPGAVRSVPGETREAS